MKIRPGFCVYTHSQDGEVFYVGKGMAKRILDPANRNALWQAKAAKGYTAEIMAWYETEAEARRVEAKWIRALKPACNMQLNGYVHSANTRAKISAGNKKYYMVHPAHHVPVTVVMCNETKQVFNGINAAGRELGIDPGGISKQLAGVFKQTGGYTFTVVGAPNGSR